MSDSETRSFDAFLPPEMARRAETVGVQKAHLPVATTFGLAVLAGAFIALGANFATVVTTGAADLPYGVAKLLGGLSFSLGLILVIVGGAELFTGNNLIVMAVASGKLSVVRLLRNWIIVYAGNLVGAVATAVLAYASGQHEFAGGDVGRHAVAIADTKCGLEFGEAVALGMLCNALVCLAVWLCLSARTTTDKVLSIVFPITAFVAAGFEHCVANMYFVPLGLFVEPYVEQAAHAHLSWSAFVWENLLPVTVGNIVGGAGMVGAVYWFIYLRHDSSRT